MHEEKELENMVMPIVKYLKENFNPYTSVTITDGGVSVTQTVLHIPVDGKND